MTDDAQAFVPRGKALEELKAKGIPAQAEPLGDTTAQAWLDARLPADANRAALAAIAPSKSVDCASLR